MKSFRDILLFVVYDEETRLPKYTKYNFDFVKYAAEKKIINSSKFDIFSAFLEETKNKDYNNVFNVNGFEKYFIFDNLGNIDQYIIDYIDTYGCTIHDNYISTKQPDTYIVDTKIDEIVLNTQFELEPYDDSMIRFIQDYMFTTDKDGNMFTKHNFNFDLYSSVFKIWGSKLNIFTDFVVRCYTLSGAFPGSFGYGLPDKFKQFFIDKNNIGEYLKSNDINTDLSSYLSKYTVTSNLTTSARIVDNIDFNTYKSIVNPDLLFINLADFKKYFYSEGQFELATFNFKKVKNIPYDLFTNICTVFSSNGNNFGTGFLFKITGDENIYIMTCYHVIGNNANLDIVRVSLNNEDKTNIVAECRIIGYNALIDACVCKFDENLNYNKVNNIDLNTLKVFDYIILSGDEVPVEKKSRLFYVGNLANDSDNAILEGHVIENKHSGSFDRVFTVGLPDSILINTSTTPGFSGSPVFQINSSNNLKLVGMYNAQANINDVVYAHVIQSSYLYTFAVNSIFNWDRFSVIYANDLISLSYIIKISTNQSWLGTIMSYYNPILSSQKYKQLCNFNYNGGILIEKFIYGFDLVNNTFITDISQVGKFNIINLETPLLKTLIYKRYIESSRTPIVLKSMSFYNSTTNEYDEINFGKYGNQKSFAIFSHGYKTISQTVLDKSKFPGKKFISGVYNTFPELKMNYYYYNGSIWVNEDIIIGGSGDEWHTLTTSTNGFSFFSSLFQLPYILYPYIRPYYETKNTIIGRGEYAGGFGRGEYAGSRGEYDGRGVAGLGEYAGGGGEYAGGKGGFNQWQRKHTVNGKDYQGTIGPR